MGFVDKMRNMFKMGTGWARQRVGSVPGNRGLVAKGRGKRLGGAARHVGEHVKDAAKNARHAIKK